MSIRALSITLSLNLPVLAMPLTALAQNLEEIIVTAQRREENLQSTPLSVAAFGGERLAELNVTDPSSLANFVPNLSIGDGTGRGNGGTQISIRGINEARISPVLDPAVGIYIDDVYYGRPQTSFLRLLDVQRVEVLRGPQGTLFGKNSTGGAVRYMTVRPSFDAVGGYVDGTVGDYGRAEIKAAVNIPFSERVALRLSGASLERDGYIRRLADGIDLGNEDTSFLQAQLGFRPSDRLDIVVALDTTETDADDGATKLIDYHGFNTTTDTTPGGATAVGAGSNSTAAWNAYWGTTALRYGPAIPRSLFEVAGQGRLGVNQADSTGGRVDIQFDFTDRLSLRSLTGWREVEEFTRRDPDDQANAYSFFDDIVEEGTDFWSQEFQINGSSESGRLVWVAGLFYSEDDPYRFEIEDRDGRSTANRGARLDNDRAQQHTESTGLYAQGTLDVTEKLALTIGIRHTEDDKLFSLSQTTREDVALVALAASLGLSPSIAVPDIAGCDPSVTDCVTVPEVSGGDTFTATTPRLAFEYQFTDDVMGYASASKGFKAGGTNDSVADITVPFQPEELWSYELGVRSDFANGRARLNATYFSMDYTDKQVTITTTGVSVGCAQRCTTNVGDAKISGWEVEALGAVTDRLQLNLALGLLDARWDSLRVDPGSNAVLGGVGPTSDFSRAPELAYTLGGRYEAPLANGGQILANLNFSYTDQQNTSPQDSTTIVIPEYELVTARVTYVPAAGNWNLSLFCTNCADEEYLTGGAAWAGATDNTFFPVKPSSFVGFTQNGLSLATAPPGISIVNVGAPRMVGLSFRYNF